MPTGPQLRVARVARGLTLAHVSQAVGVSIATLSRIEHGRAPLHDDVRQRMMHTVGWTEAFDRLFEDLTPGAEAERPPASVTEVAV